MVNRAKLKWKFIIGVPYFDTESDRLHDKNSVWKGTSNLLHTREILDWIPDVPVFIQQLEFAYRENRCDTGGKKGVKSGKGNEREDRRRLCCEMGEEKQ